MRERPILFSAPMVRSLLDGSKTQTRRVLKQATGPSLSVGIEGEHGVAELSWLHGDGPGHEVHETVKRVRCPYGAPGDRLWVRESLGHGLLGHFYAASHADGPSSMIDYEREGPPSIGLPARSIPSIHMPRWASRITLEVTGVRVERLNAISDADAVAEGIGLTESAIGVPMTIPAGMTMPRALYRTLWESINGAGSWDANPWVWCVEFRRI